MRMPASVYVRSGKAVGMPLASNSWCLYVLSELSTVFCYALKWKSFEFFLRFAFVLKIESSVGSFRCLCRNIPMYEHISCHFLFHMLQSLKQLRLSWEFSTTYILYPYQVIAKGFTLTCIQHSRNWFIMLHNLIYNSGYNIDCFNSLFSQSTTF